MDPELVQAAAQGVAAGVGSIGILALIFRGKSVVLRREIDAQQAADGERINDLKAANSKLEQTVEELRKEIREKDNAMVATVREVLHAVDFLNGLAGLAQRDRRSDGRRT